MLLGERVERHASPPRGGDSVSECSPALDVSGINGRPDQDVARLCLTGLNAIDANDVEAIARLDDWAHLARRKAEEPSLERRNHLAATRPSEIAADILRSEERRVGKER